MEKVKQLLRNPGSPLGRGSKHDEAQRPPVARRQVDLPPPVPPMSKNPPRLLIIGAGSRGYSFARAILHASNGFVSAVADPIPSKRKKLGQHHIWGVDEPKDGQEFTDWRHFLQWELERRERARRGEEDVPAPIDGAVICTMDQTHAEIVVGLAPLNLHLLCEKPLATTFDDCLRIYKTVQSMDPPKLFGIGHILRYAPRNTLLRKLLFDDEVVGEVVSVVHTEPVGWWHFAHSYVRGNWRVAKTSGPTILTKSCHDIDLLLWLLCSPSPSSAHQKPHLPSSVTATGSLVHFKRSRKPDKAGNATNCLSCAAEPDCQYSSRNIYYEKGLRAGLPGWPVNVVVPDIEDYFNEGEEGVAKSKLMEALAEDYDVATTPSADIERRSWYGRCVYESDNDVCDEYTVTISWEDDPITAPSDSSDQTDQHGSSSQPEPLQKRGSKTATFHMTAFSEAMGGRRTVVYGTKGEMDADNEKITVREFGASKAKVHKTPLTVGGHGGGDHGLARQFVLAMDAVKNHGVAVEEAQRAHLGCTPEDILRSHAMVFAAEEARRQKMVVDWKQWWNERIPTSDDGEVPVPEEN